MSEAAEFGSLDDILEIDKVVHEPARLMLMAMLRVVRRADFVFLQGQTGLTAGNISSHIKKLANAGYVVVEKSFVDNRPQTMLSLSPAGRAALRRYLRTMRVVLEEID
jgi:DNA-binding MarR family transcriptional regulator